jgi:hypothetical protein
VVAAGSQGSGGERLRFLRERCTKLGLDVRLSDEDFWWFCFAECAFSGLVGAGELGLLSKMFKVPQKKLRAGKAVLVQYLMSKFPTPFYRRGLVALAREFFPACFAGGSPAAVLEAVEKSGRDPGAARFLLRARGAEVALPEGFHEEEARVRYEICIREHALRAVEGDPRVSALKQAVEAAFERHQEEIARLRAKLDRGAKAVTEKAAEAEKYRKLAEEALQKMQEMEEFYRAELERLTRRVRELERQLARNEIPAGAPDQMPEPLRVLVMGDPARESAVEAALEKLGARVAYIDGADESFDGALVRHADIAVVSADYGRHAALYKLRSEAKRRGVPVVTVPAGTPSAVARAVQQHLRVLGQEVAVR